MNGISTSLFDIFKPGTDPSGSHIIGPMWAAAAFFRTAEIYSIAVGNPEKHKCWLDAIIEVMLETGRDMSEPLAADLPSVDCAIENLQNIGGLKL